MSILKITCTCGKELSIDIKTIDTLRAERNKLRRELHNCKSRLTALELKNKSNPFNAMFGG